MLKQLFRFNILFFILWIIGQFLKEKIWLTEICFCIASPVVFVIFFISSLFVLYKKNVLLGSTLLFVSIVPGYTILFVDNHFSVHPAEKTPENYLRLIHWNVDHGNFGWNGIVKKLREDSPDIVIISEKPDKVKGKSIGALFGEDFDSIGISNMAVAARGRLHGGKWLWRNRNIHAYGIIWDSPQGECRLMIVDLASSVFIPRRERLETLNSLIKNWQPDIIVGDFNAPRRSHTLSNLPEGYTHAYNTVGSGWSYTWPLPFPVYSIDQCIAGANISPVRYVLKSSWKSDHRRQIFDFNFSISEPRQKSEF